MRADNYTHYGHFIQHAPDEMIFKLLKISLLKLGPYLQFL